MPLQQTTGNDSYDAYGGGVAAIPNYIEDVFSNYLYVGNGSTQTINNGIDLAGKGGMVWIKRRDAAINNVLFSTANPNDTLVSNLTGGSYGFPSTYAFAGYNSTGFDLNGSWTGVNASGGTYTSWTFRKAAKFFDVVTYTGNDSSNRQISHNLGSVPGCIIVKSSGLGGSWYVYHKDLGTDKFLMLNSTNASGTTTLLWNNTAPTATNFTVGSPSNNSVGDTYVAYLFAHDASYTGLIQCGSYSVDNNGKIINGDGTGTQVDLGWEPQFIILKDIRTSGSWKIYDTMRDMPVANPPTTANNKALLANSSAAEASVSYYGTSPTATGFTGQGDATNLGQGIYIAIRRPNKPPTSGTQVFYPETHSNPALSTKYTYTTGFPVDMLWQAVRSPAYTGKFLVTDRLRATNGTTSSNSFQTSATDNETTINGYASLWFDNNTGYSVNDTNGSWNGSPSYPSAASWSFRRAPGFFDVVCYTGTGVARTVNHNLGAVPELIIVKNRSETGRWIVSISTSLYGVGNYMFLENNEGISDYGWPNYIYPAATTTVLNIGYDSSYGVNVNKSADNYVAYLFASLTGISKIGKYTGNGSSQTINCGFAAGARFILIKRTDSTGDWKVIDSARGIVAGNDPTLALNSTAAEVTGTDCIDPDSSGFIVNQESTNNLNVNSATYIYLAIA